jgi:hypothetical protein
MNKKTFGDVSISIGGRKLVGKTVAEVSVTQSLTADEKVIAEFVEERFSECCLQGDERDRRTFFVEALGMAFATGQAAALEKAASVAMAQQRRTAIATDTGQAYNAGVRDAVNAIRALGAK